MTPIIIPQIVAERYREACANPTIARWNSLSYMARLMADRIEDEVPGSELADNLLTLSNLAWQHSMDLEPERDEAHHNSLSGVVLGWFGRFRRAA